MNIAKSIRVAQAKHDINRQVLAERTGIHETNISKMVNGKHGISSLQVELFAKAFDMKVSEFVALGED
jgi:DNA-binding Xre family transcriptional regulator